MTYLKLIEDLQKVERETGLYLSDMSVDAQNATSNSDADLFEAAASAAGERASDAGYDINELIGYSIY